MIHSTHQLKSLLYLICFVRRGTNHLLHKSSWLLVLVKFIHICVYIFEVCGIHLRLLFHLLLELYCDVFIYYSSINVFWRLWTTVANSTQRTTLLRQSCPTNHVGMNYTILNSIVILWDKVKKRCDPTTFIELTKW